MSTFRYCYSQGTNEKLSNELMTVDVGIINTTLCNHSYGEVLDNSMICAGDFELGNVDACQVIKQSRWIKVFFKT